MQNDRNNVDKTISNSIGIWAEFILNHDFERVKVQNFQFLYHAWSIYFFVKKNFKSILYYKRIKMLQMLQSYFDFMVCINFLQNY